MNNAIAIVGLVVIVFVVCIFFKAVISSVSGFANKLPRWISFVILVVALILAVILLGYIFDHSIIFGTPGNSEATVTDDGNALEDSTQEQAENTIVLRGDDIIIDGDETDLAGAERYIAGFVDSDQTLIIVDDYSTSYLHHRITDICNQKNVEPKCVDNNGYEE